MGERVQVWLCRVKSWRFTLDFHTIYTWGQRPLRGYLWSAVIAPFGNQCRRRWRTHIFAISNSLIGNLRSFLHSFSFIPLNDAEVMILDLNGKTLAPCLSQLAFYLKEIMYHSLCFSFHRVGDRLPVGAKVMDEVLEVCLFWNRPVTGGCGC